MPGAVAGPLAALGIVLGTVLQGHRGEGAVYATQHHHYHRLCRRHDGVGSGETMGLRNMP